MNKKPEPPSRSNGRPDGSSPADGNHATPSLLSRDTGRDVLAKVLKEGPEAANRRRRVPRVGVPLGVPFRTREESLGVAKLLPRNSPPYDFYLLASAAWELLDVEIPDYRLFLGVTLDGDWFVAPTLVEGFRGNVAKTELTAIAQATCRWVLVEAPAKGMRVIVECDDLGVPAFPDLDAETLVTKAFQGATILTYDAPELDVLAGRFKKQS